MIGVSFLFLVFLPETLASRILQNNAAKLNKETGSGRVRFVAPADVDKTSFWVSLVSS